MSITERLPGMEPGATLRNLVVGYGYFLGALLAILLFPLVAGVVIGTNYRGIADKAAKLPGVGPDGGVKSGAIASVYALVLWIVVVGAGGESGGNDIESEDEFEAELEANGIDVDYINMVSGWLNIDYYTEDSSDEIVRDEVRVVALAYAELVDSGHDSDLLNTIVMDRHEGDIGGYSIDATWAQEYADGDRSEEEYIDRVVETITYDD